MSEGIDSRTEFQSISKHGLRGVPAPVRSMEGVPVITRIRMFAAVTAIALCPDSLAITGNATIVAINPAGPGSPATIYGYSNGTCTGGATFGLIANATLSDGKSICVFLDFSGSVALSISGFMTDPGQSYFNNVNISCVLPPTTFSSASAFTYIYSGGVARWFWSRTNRCMEPPLTTYVIGIS
jgi:hypothetical protein